MGTPRGTRPWGIRPGKSGRGRGGSERRPIGQATGHDTRRVPMRGLVPQSPVELELERVGNGDAVFEADDRNVAVVLGPDEVATGERAEAVAVLKLIHEPDPEPPQEVVLEIPSNEGGQRQPPVLAPDREQGLERCEETGEVVAVKEPGEFASEADAVRPLFEGLDIGDESVDQAGVVAGHRPERIDTLFEAVEPRA